MTHFYSVMPGKKIFEIKTGNIKNRLSLPPSGSVRPPGHIQVDWLFQASFCFLNPQRTAFDAILNATKMQIRGKGD